MKQKAFTLFTALVSFVLIVLAVLLIQSMIRTERNTTDVISDIRELEEMQAIADLARADAFQVFNFGIRYTIEEWLIEDEDGDNIPGNSFLLTPDLADWDAIQERFATTMFGGSTGGEQFASRTANHLINLLAKQPDVRGYNVSLSAPDEATLSTTLQHLFVESTDAGEFFKLIKCPDGKYNNCLGTFYVNLNLADLNDQAYESFPQIEIENTVTGRVLKEPILPRGKLQIYIPLRIFKAIAGAWEIAKSNGNGILDNTFQSRVENMRLGLCDSGSCKPRENPETPTHGTLQDYACPGDDSHISERLPSVPVGNDHYDPSNDSSMKSRLKRVAEDRINAKINTIATQIAGLSDVANSRFEIQQGENANVAKEVATATAAEHSKDIESQGNNAGDAYCAEVFEMQATIVFRELNEKYKVINRTNKENIYGIRILDNSYSLFSNPAEICRTTISNINLQQKYDCEPG